MKQTGPAVHFIPHSPVFRPESKTTPLRIVYDASAKAGPDAPSLNDCLETGPNLLPKIFEILLRNRFRRYVIVGDIKKAFHQIEVDPEDRDAQRVRWYDDLQERNVSEFRFARVIFGAISSPYILNATVEKHLDQFKDDPDYADTIKDLQLFTYVDDVSGGGDSLEDVKRFKREASTLLQTWGVPPLQMEQQRS